MPYCTQTDLLKMVSPETLAAITAESGDTPDAAVVLAAIAQADAEIDSYLAVRYQLPLTATPPLVKNLSVDLALYNLFSRRDVGMPEVRQKKRDDALRLLRDVAAGKAQIVGADGIESPADAGDVVEITSQTRIFSRDEMGDW